jgi:excisionase family DNA binding protein
MSADQMFLSREEAAQAAGVKLDTIRRAIRSGKLRAKRTSRDKNDLPSGRYLISREALAEWFDGLADA